MPRRMALEEVTRRAIDGDRDALDGLVRDLQGDIYGLALRMLWNREDAEDATQEILVRGEILDMPGPEAADALEITPDVFRKRLQHARAAILSFTRSYCGLASDTAACACNRRVPAALRTGRVRADSFDFAATGSSFQEARAIVRQVDEARWALAVHRTSRPRDSAVDFARRLASALDAQGD